MSRVASTTVGVLVGGAIGAAAALLFAPKRGEELRSDVKHWTVDIEHKAADKIRDAGSSMATGIRQVPKVVAEQAPKVMEKVGSVFHRGQEASESTAEKVEQGSQEMSGRMDQAAEQM